MHFITGGAFNGKRSWVKKVYQVDKNDGWLSAYDNLPPPENFNRYSQQLIILEGIEIWLKALIAHHEIKQSRDIWNSYLQKWITFENEKTVQNLVIIGTDITKGIVPLDREDRLWRDLTGWAYQDTAAMASKVDVIWYGINHTIKYVES